jgi:GT2 family glycosyltransferase
VIGNAPEDDRTETLVRLEFPSARYECEPVLGLDFARNRALRVARQTIVAFTDDDAVADPQWIAEIRRAFRDHPGAVVCTGEIDPLELETEAQRLFEANGGLFTGGDEPLRLPIEESGSLRRRCLPNVAWAASIGSGCNLAVRRDFALDLGGFDEALDLGAELPGGGDTDFLWRTLETGAELIYQPTARVRHQHRREMDAVVRQILGHQRGLIAFLTKASTRAPRTRRLPALAFLAWRLVKPGVRLARRAVGRDPLPPGVLFRVWWSCWRGLSAYGAGARAARQRRDEEAA